MNRFPRLLSTVLPVLLALPTSWDPEPGGNAMALAPVPWRASQSTFTAPRPPAPKVGPVFKITLEYGSASPGSGSLKGKVVGLYAPSAMWIGHFGINYSLLGSSIGRKGIDESSPAAMYAALGNIAAMRPDDLLQFYKFNYSGSFTTDNGCSLSDSGSETPDTYTAWITRTKDGAILQFGTLEIGDVNSKCDHWNETFTKEFGSADAKKMEEFFTFRLSNKDLANFGSIEKTNSCSLKAERDDQGTAWGKATLTADIRPPEGEVLVEPDAAYDKWVPEGNLANSEKRGNNLLVRVSVQSKSGSGRPPKAKIVFTMKKVSMEKGVCLNWPAKAAKIGYGLKFLQEENPDLDVPGPDEAKTKEYVEDALFDISAFDFGAWGILKITAKDGQGHDLKVRVRGQDQSELSLPLDENHNHIADAWELANAGNLSGQENDDLDDAPPGKPGTPGDGLSLYEEYRGFVVKGGHIRTSPKKKDYFVCDLSGIAGPGIQFFEEKTSLVVHRVTQEELGGEPRIVNQNYSGASHTVDQHGVLIRSAQAGIKDPEAISAPPGLDPGPPGTTEYVAMPETDYVSDPMTVKGAQGAMAASVAVVAHELCHTVGVFHHGEADIMAVKWEWLTGADGKKRLFEMPMSLDRQPVPSGPGVEIRAIRESDGQELKPEDDLPTESKDLAGVFHVFWKSGPKKEGTQGSGASSCIMCYSIGRAYPSSKRPGVRYVIPPQERVRDPFAMMLCDSGSGTGTNDSGHPLESHHGPAASGRGDCKGQIVVNDKYSKK